MTKRQETVLQVFASGLITAVEQLMAKDAELAKLRADLAAAKAEINRWFEYVDPYDIWPQDADAYNARKAAIDAAIAGSKT